MHNLQSKSRKSHFNRHTEHLTIRRNQACVIFIHAISVNANIARAMG